MEIEPIVRKMASIRDYEYLLTPGTADTYYNSLWQKIKDTLEELKDDKEVLINIAKLLDEYVDELLDYVSGSISSHAIATFFGYYGKGFVYDIKNLLPVNNDEIEKITASHDALQFSELLLDTSPFERIDITYKHDFVQSLNHYYSLQCNTFDEILQNIPCNLIIINATNEPHVNYSLTSIASINDSTMIDSILHIRRKNPKIFDLPTISSINEHTALQDQQKNNYNRFFGLSCEKNADPLKNYKKPMIELNSLPPMPLLVNKFASHNHRKTVTLFVTKYTVHLCPKWVPQ